MTLKTEKDLELSIKTLLVKLFLAFYFYKITWSQWGQLFTIISLLLLLFFVCLFLFYFVVIFGKWRLLLITTQKKSGICLENLDLCWIKSVEQNEALNSLFFLKDIIQDWQKAASNVLVALGVNASQEVMIEMLKKINPGALPHYYVILTLANLAKENGLFFIFDWDLQRYSFLKHKFHEQVSHLTSHPSIKISTESILILS